MSVYLTPFAQTLESLKIFASYFLSFMEGGGGKEGKLVGGIHYEKRYCGRSSLDSLAV